MPVISVANLMKTYRVAQKRDEGFWSAVKGLFRREYQTVRAVDGISFEIESGEMVAFLGPNGAGKTTTLKMLSGLIYPSGGQAEVLGFIPWERADAYRRRFALVMGQKNQLWWDLPARESFRLHREIYGIPSDQFQRVHDELIDLLSIGRLIGQPVRELSLGERMKMELVAALLHSPQVLFLDEPTIGLDVVAQNQLRDFLRRYNEEYSVTVLLTSHYMRDVERLCDRVIIINHGRLAYDGSLAGIQAEFNQTKLLKLQFADDVPADLDRLGEVVEIRGPIATLRVDRQSATHCLSEALRLHRIVDVTVDEAPLEDVIATVFETGSATRAADD